MMIEPGALREHLAPEETLLTAGPGRLVEPAYRAGVSIGLTDRRLILLADDGGFVDVGHDAVHAIRSRPRTTLTSGELAARAMVIGGVLVATLAVAGLLVLATSYLVPAFALLGVGSIVAVEYVLRAGIELDGSGIVGATGPLDERLRRPIGDERFRRVETRVATVVDEYPILPATGGVLALCGFVGVVVLAGHWGGVALPVLALGGFALVDTDSRRIRDLADRDERRRREREVRIDLVDGRTVTVRIAAEQSIDRDIGRLVRGTATDPIDADAGLTPSSAAPD